MRFKAVLRFEIDLRTDFERKNDSSKVSFAQNGDL